MNINLETLSLCSYNEEKYKEIIDEFVLGTSKSSFVHNIRERLMASKNIKDFSFQTAYLVLDNNNPIGYIYISQKVNDDVFLEFSVLNEYRKQGYGKKIINEVSDYLFENYNIKSIKLDIDPSNKKSIATAISCGFDCDEEEFYERNCVGKMVFIKDSNCYVTKRRKF